MSPYFSYEAPSAFGDISPCSIGVLVTYPAANEWFVIMDKKSAKPLKPLFETDSLAEAKRMADQFAVISDLAFLSTALADKTAVRYVESSLTCSESNDGLDLIPQSMVQSSASAILDSSFDRVTESSSEWNTWLDNRASVLAHRPRTLIFSFDVKVEVKDGDDIDLETRSNFVLAEMDWGINDLKGISIKTLDGHYEINGKPLHRLLHEIEISPEHEIWVAETDELDDWLPVTERMPLFTALHKPDQTSRIYAYEGGPVLKSIAATRPWMVAKDDQGNAVPLRIVKAQDYENVTEAGLKDDQHFIAAVFMKDQLTLAARSEVIKAQQRQGIEPGQVTPHGQFVKVAEIDSDVTLEAMFDRKTPNVIGTRDWVNYRLWIEGELVLDVHPGNSVQHDERTVSLSPMTGQLDPAEFSMTSDQIGELLATALSESSDQEETALPARVAKFLRSSRCEELQGDGQAIESGEAVIENGKLLRREETDDEAQPEPL